MMGAVLYVAGAVVGGLLGVRLGWLAVYQLLARRARQLTA